MSDSQKDPEYNRGGLIAFLFSMGAAVLFFAYIVIVHPGIDLGEKVVDPKAPDESGARMAFDISKVAEPWVTSPELVAYGEKMYQTNCALCHGPGGLGDGPGGAGTNPPPRNLVEGKWTQGEGLIARYQVLTKGISGSSMASYAHFKPADRWALVHYVESITKNKSKDNLSKVQEFAKSAK